MAFLPLNHEEGKLTLMPCVTSITITKGDALVDNGSGYLTSAEAGTAVEVRYVAAETVTTTFTGQQVSCYSTLSDTAIRFIADTDANPAQTDVGTEADLATVSTVNPDASTHDIFFIESVVLPLTKKKVKGYFISSVPNS